VGLLVLRHLDSAVTVGRRDGRLAFPHPGQGDRHRRSSPMPGDIGYLPRRDPHSLVSRRKRRLRIRRRFPARSAGVGAGGTDHPVPPCHREQSTATSRAAQMARVLVSASRPSRLTNTATETLSTESRFTAERRGIGSESGSRTTSLASPRMVVVQGATSVRRSRGIATSRDSTTTGRRPISAISHHHTSPRAGSAIRWRRPPAATRPGRPTRRVPQPGARRRLHSSRPPRPIDDGRAMPPGPHR